MRKYTSGILFPYHAFFFSLSLCLERCLQAVNFLGTIQTYKDTKILYLGH